MESFNQIAKDVYLLKVPFGPVWTGVILLRGEKNILVDSSATGQDVDTYIIPALSQLGLDMTDIQELHLQSCTCQIIRFYRFAKIYLLFH